MPDSLPMMVIIFIVLMFLAAIGLYFALILKRKPRNDVPLFAANSRQDLSGNEATYFSYIKFDPEKNAIVLKQSQVFKKCVVTLISKKGNVRKQEKFNLEYAEGDLYCGIILKEPIDEFKVVLESVDGNVQKHDPIDSFLTLNILYAVVVSVLFIIAAILLITMDGYLADVMEEEGFPLLYGLVLLVVIYVIVIIGGCLIGEILSKKGKF